MDRYTKAGRVVLAVLGIWAIALMAGCNTMEGAGKDVESAGEAIQDAAD